MKKTIYIFIISAILLSFIAGAIFAAEETMQEPKVKPKQSEDEKITTFPKDKTSNSVFVIDPKKRADDLKKCFETLKKDKPSSRIFFKLKDGSTIANILDITPLENGTMIIFKTSSTQGTKFIIAPIEDIDKIGHL